MVGQHLAGIAGVEHRVLRKDLRGALLAAPHLGTELLVAALLLCQERLNLRLRRINRSQEKTRPTKILEGTTLKRVIKTHVLSVLLEAYYQLRIISS